MGGSEAAVKRYRNLGAPNLIIVESLSDGFTLFGELAELAEVLPPEAQVIVAGASNDVALYRELMRNGVSDYLVTPCAPMQAIEAIVGAFDAPDAAPIAKCVTVYGVRGGAGASMLAQNLSYELAELVRKETVLVDLNVQFGTSALGFNIEPKHSIVDACRDVDDLDDVKLARLLHKQTDHLKLLPAPVDLTARGLTSESEALSLVDVARKSCELLVLDAPSGWGAAARVALRQAAIPVLVATPDLVSLRNLRAVADWLEKERPNDLPPKIVLNQVGQAKRPEISEKEFSDIIGAPIDLSLQWDPAAYGAALGDGSLLRNSTGGQIHADMIKCFGETLIGRPVLRAPAAGGLSRLLSAIGLSK